VRAHVTLYQLRDRVGTQQAGLATLRTEVERLQGVVDRLTALIETKSSDNP
jgi:hypothetical protein